MHANNNHGKQNGKNTSESKISYSNVKAPCANDNSYRMLDREALDNISKNCNLENKIKKIECLIGQKASSAELEKLAEKLEWFLKHNPPGGVGSYEDVLYIGTGSSTVGSTDHFTFGPPIADYRITPGLVEQIIQNPATYMISYSISYINNGGSGASISVQVNDVTVPASTRALVSSAGSITGMIIQPSLLAGDKVSLVNSGGTTITLSPDSTNPVSLTIVQITSTAI